MGVQEGATAAVDAVTIAQLFRAEYGRAVAILVRAYGDIDLAQEAVQEAFESALRRWPSTGLPASPQGWIVTTARNKAIDTLRRESTRDDRQASAMRLHAHGEGISQEATVTDDRLRLIFTCCHPALGMPVQIALTLRLLGGLTTPEIARAQARRRCLDALIATLAHQAARLYPSVDPSRPTRIGRATTSRAQARWRIESWRTMPLEP